MSRGRAGARLYDGRQLILHDRYVGLGARGRAADEAARLRADGYFVRVHKVFSLLTDVGEVGDFMLYSLKNEDGPR